MKKGTKIICIILGILIILGLILLAVDYIKIRYIEKNVFNAKIEKITEYEGITTVLIEGLDTNDINHRGKFDFVVTEKTKLLWRGFKRRTNYFNNCSTRSFIKIPSKTY